MPSNSVEYDQQYWLEHGGKHTLKARLARAEAENERLRASVHGMCSGYANAVTDYKAEIERLRNLLAECFPLVRPGTDLSRRLRETLMNEVNALTRERDNPSGSRPGG